MPRCSMFVTQPNAIIGQLSIVRYALNATNWPTVIRPRITSRLPSHTTISAPSPRKKPMLGKKNPCSTIRRAIALQVLVVRPAEPLELRRFLTIGADDADARERLLRDGAHVGQLRLNPLEPLVDRPAEELDRNRHERQRDERPCRVSRASIDDHHRQRDRERQHRVGRVHDRRADHHPHGAEVVGRARHQVAGAMRLEIRRAAASRRCAKKSLRMLYSMSRDAPMRIRRCRNRNTPPTQADRQQQRAVAGELARG